jgi:hypothetical protein
MTLASGRVPPAARTPTNVYVEALERILDIQTPRRTLWSHASPSAIAEQPQGGLGASLPEGSSGS